MSGENSVRWGWRSGRPHSHLMQLVHCVWQLQALQEARALAVAGDAEVLQDRRTQVAGGAAQP